MSALTEKLATIAKSIEVLEAARTAQQAWDRDKARLSKSEPEVPKAPAAVQVPDVPRPTPEAIEWAAGIDRDVTAASSAACEIQRGLKDAERLLGLCEKAASLASAEAARVAVLADACRRAPTHIARQQAEALGDMGCVSLRFPPKETKDTPEMEVLIDGRPWWLASDGRQVVGDLLIRAALRRAAGLDVVPIWVDHASLWSGEWPDVPGPVVVLRTVPYLCPHCGQAVALEHGRIVTHRSTEGDCPGSGTVVESCIEVVGLRTSEPVEE